MKQSRLVMITLVVLLLAAAVLPAPVLAAGYTTTELRIAKYANDRTTVLNETTVDYNWLKANLPIQGDGVTRYYHQGPVFEGDWEKTHPGEPYDGWNPGEDVLRSMLVKADLGAVMGTDIKDICNHIGGAKEGDDIAICSSDGWRKAFPYPIIYEPDPRQGPAVICWYSGNGSGPDAQEAQGQGYPDTGYVIGMRMIFFADDSTNPWGWHIFGNNDMKECWDEDYWNKGGDYWSAAGTSGKWVNEIRIYSQEDPPEEPVAGFTANVTSGAIPLVVRFTDTSENGPTAWEWDFGDGATSTEQNPVHTYKKVGTYDVTLTVTNVAGSDSTETTVTAGIIDFTASVTSGAVPLAVKFTDTSDGKPTAWEWDFGDGETSDEQNPDHTYETAGTYTVTLTVTYPAGGSNSITREKYITAGSGSVSGSGGGSDSSETTTPVPENTTATPDEFSEEILENRTFRPGVPDIEEIVVSAPEIPENLTISCETTGLPEEIPEPPGEVYRYYTFTPGDGNVTVSEAVIRFSVPDTWIRENRIDVNNLTLYRYNKTWTPLKTRWTGTVNGTHTFEATSPGFSLFAISGKKAEPPPAATVTPVKTSTPAASVAPGKDERIITNPLMLAFGHIAAASAPTGGLPGRLIGAVWAFLGLFGVIPAAPLPAAAELAPEPVPTTPDPVPAAPAPVPTIDITRMQFALSVLSDPPGALVDLDGEYTGKTTPAVFASLSGGNHTVRVYTDSGGPEERTVLLERDDEILVKLPGASPGALQAWDQNHYGGVYVASYPEGAEIRVDNCKVNRKTPTVIYGLKEGLHTIKVQQGKVAFKYDKERVWVERNSITPVTFTSGNADLVRSIRLESDEFTKKPFSINGRYLGDKFPKKVDIRGAGGSYITVRDGDGSYRSYRIPATAESGDTVNAAFSDAPCSLLVTSVPSGAAISIDGFQTGFAAPYVIRNISEGKHQVSVSKPGYIPAEQEFHLTDNRGDACDATVKVILEPYIWGSLNVSSTPSNAEIHIYGRDTGEKTSHTFHYLDIGSYTVKVTVENESRTIEDVLVSPYATAECHVDLPRGGLKDVSAP